MTLTLEDLLANEVTRPATIRYLCGIRRDLYDVPASDAICKWQAALERYCRSWDIAEQRAAFIQGRAKIKSRMEEREALTPPPVPVEVVKPTAPVLTKEKVLEYLNQAFTDLKEEEEGAIYVNFGECLDFVATDHLKDGTYVWDDQDSRMSGKTQRWKSLVSTALQDLQESKVVSYRDKTDRWFIFPD